MKVVIVGGGPAGYVAALKAKKLGADVVLIEKDELGGTCLNRGCIPTKSIIHNLELFEKAKKQLINNQNKSIFQSIDLQSIMEKKDTVVETQKKGLAMLLKESGVKIINSYAEFTDSKILHIFQTKEKITADRIIIASGSRPAILPMLEFDGQKILSSDDLWNLKKIPKSIIIIGAGAIGCEFAWIFNLLGSKVFLVELMPRVLPMEDEEISKALERLFKKRKIEYFTEKSIIDLVKTEEYVEITLSDGNKIRSDFILLSVGRAFNTEFLKNSSIKLGRKGEIIVDEHMKTNIEGVFAAGDVNGKWLLAHVAYKEGEIASRNALGEKQIMDYSIIPSTIFTVAEVASVGFKEMEAIEKAINIKKAIFPFRAVGKAHVIGEIDGFVKLIVDKDNDILIGAHIIGPKSSELIHELALAIKFKIKTKELKDLIHSHPTLSECIGEAFADIHGDAIHKLEK